VFNRKDSLAFFLQGHLSDKVQTLKKDNEIYKLEDAIIKRAKITKSSNKYLIVLIINDHASFLI